MRLVESLFTLWKKREDEIYLAVIVDVRVIWTIDSFFFGASKPMLMRILWAKSRKWNQFIWISFSDFNWQLSIWMFDFKIKGAIAQSWSETFKWKLFRFQFYRAHNSQPPHQSEHTVGVWRERWKHTPRGNILKFFVWWFWAHCSVAFAKSSIIISCQRNVKTLTRELGGASIEWDGREFN